MISRFWPFSAPLTTHCNDLLEGTAQGDTGKWWKVCCPKLMSFGSLIMLGSLFVSIVILEHHTEVGVNWRIPNVGKVSGASACKAQNKQHSQRGSEPLPRGIVQETSDLKLRPLWIDSDVKEVSESRKSLLAMAVGIKQKETVNQIIGKFPPDNFTVMLFHYDGVVDEWNTFSWSNQAIHIAAINQTKWWFAKRFLHPDIVAPYNYIFIWDEDIGVTNFHAGRYLAIVEEEGLEISQPALDPRLSEIHHQITVRRTRDRVHRRMYKFRGSGLCFENSTQPPCTGWVEMMVPVFSRAVWRCAWHMIQNDLVHSWGMDMKLGYCVQGDRSKKVGVVDDQYIVHQGIPSLGGLFNKTWEARSKTKGVTTRTSKNGSRTSSVTELNDRGEIRKRSYEELEIFRRRWKQAARQDKCWVDPY